jgi:flagellar protein FliO/FliZ
MTSPAVRTSSLTSLTRLLSAGSLVLLSLAASGQSDKPFAAPAAAAASAPASAASLAQVTVSLLLVLAAVFAAAWVVRRVRGLGKFGSQAITVIADVGLGPKERAVLVQVGSQQLLLGVAPGRVSTLHVLTEPVAKTSMAAPAAAAAEVPLPPDFKAILKRSLGLQ